MARKVRDKALDSKAERRKLKPSTRPYYRAIGAGLHLGFRKGKAGGVWVVRLYAGNQAYKVESIGRAEDDLADADGDTVLTFDQAVERARDRQKQRTTSTGKVAGPYTVRQAVEDYLTFIQAKKGRATAYDSRRRADTLILPALGNVDAALLTAAQIRKWHAAIASSPPRIRGRNGADAAAKPRYRAFNADDPEAIRRRRSSANRTLAVLKATLNFGFHDGKIASDAEWRRAKPFESVDAARIRYLSVAEAQRLVNASDPDFRRLILGALHTGCRYGELTRLRVQDFNVDSETLAIRISKSGKSRHVEVTAEGAGFFREITAGRGGSELMFEKATGGAWKTSHQRRPIIEASARAHLSPPIDFHSLRHSWASLSVMNGVPLMVIAKNLGHADTRMVEKHYGHMSPSHVRDAIRAGAPTFGFKSGNVKTLPTRA